MNRHLRSAFAVDTHLYSNKWTPVKSVEVIAFRVRDVDQDYSVEFHFDKKTHRMLLKLADKKGKIIKKLYDGNFADEIKKELEGQKSCGVR
jgi:ribosomal protein S10